MIISTLQNLAALLADVLHKLVAMFAFEGTINPTVPHG